MREPFFTQERWPLAGPSLLLVAAWFALAWPWLSDAVTIPWDAQAHFVPQMQFLAGSLAHGEAPFWNPYVFGGHPQIADPQSLIFSPPFLALAALVPSPTPWTVDFVVLGSLLAGAFAVMLLCRDHGWHPAAAILAALVFAFGGSSAWRIQHVGQIMSLAAWPIAWLLLERALRRSSLSYGFAAGLVAGVLVLGRDQVAFLAIGLLVGVVVVHILTAPQGWAALRQAIRPLTAGIIGGLIIITVPLTLTILLQEVSNRTEIDLEGAERGSLHPSHLLTAIVPQLYGTAGPIMQDWGVPSPFWGPVDLFLARNMGHIYMGALPIVLIAMLVWRRPILRRRFVWPPLIALALVGAYALGRYTPLFSIAFKLVPGVDLFRRPSDATFLMGPLVGLLAAGLFDTWLRPREKRARRQELTIAGAVVLGLMGIALIVAIGKNRLPEATWPVIQAMLFAALAFFVVLVAPRLAARPLVLTALVAALLVADLRWNNGPNESTGLSPAIYDILRPDTANETIGLLRAKVAEGASPTRRDRVELAGIDFHWPNATMTHRLDHTLGYNPVRLRWYADATGAQDQIAVPDQRVFTPLFPSYRSTLANLLGLRFIASRIPIEEIDTRLKPGDLPLIAKTKDAYIYENAQAAPRLRFVPNAAPANFDAMIETGIWPEFDLSQTVLLEDAAPTAPRAGGTAALLTYRNNEVVIDTDSPEGGYVVLHDTWHPWWFAEIGGTRVPVLRANVIFRAVPVPAGRHRVRLTFRPFEGAWRELRQRYQPSATIAPTSVAR